MPNYSNISSVPLSLGVFLATDGYDHNPDTSVISVTTLLKPIRQIILGNRVPAGDASVDLVQMMASRMGSAIHDGIERSWVHNYKTAMQSLGLPQRVIERVRINPTREQLLMDKTVGNESIPIYLEQRSQKQVGNYAVSGKFDFVGDGRVEDFKTTSTYTAMHGTNDDKHAMQGSLYRWLNPDIITKDEMAIQFIFTDWSKAKAMQDPKYPQSRIQQRIHKLKPLNEIDAYVKSKLGQIDRYMAVEEPDLPHCTDEDLWRSEPVFKYYKNPDKTSRSTKNFDTKQEAMIRMAEDGGKGIVLEKPGQVTACKYCNAFSLCSQKDALVAQGDLVL